MRFWPRLPRHAAAFAFLVGSLVAVFAVPCRGQDAKEDTVTRSRRATDLGLLPADQWDRLDSAVDRGLSFLSREQQPDGSFPTWADGQPGVTSLCIMAFLARGHQPGKGPYGPQIERAIDYVLEMQDQRVGATAWPTDGSAARSFASRTAKIARLPAITTMELPA